MTTVSTQHEPTIIVKRPTDNVAWLVLNRPAQLNALTFEMFGSLTDLCRELDSDDDVRCIVISGAGRGFCAGLDLDCAATLGAMTAEQMLQRQAGWAYSITAFQRLSKPVIAAVNGTAAGAGLGLALSADIRFASDKARFTTAFVRIGLSGGDVGVSWLLPRIVGMGAATELLMTSRIIDSDEALRLGLVTKIVDSEQLIDQAIDTALEIASRRPLALTLTKQALRVSQATGSLDSALELENRNQVIATRDAGMAAGLEAVRTRR